MQKYILQPIFGFIRFLPYVFKTYSVLDGFLSLAIAFFSFSFIFQTVNLNYKIYAFAIVVFFLSRIGDQWDRPWPVRLVESLLISAMFVGIGYFLLLFKV